MRLYTLHLKSQDENQYTPFSVQYGRLCDDGIQSFRRFLYNGRDSLPPLSVPLLIPLLMSHKDESNRVCYFANLTPQLTRTRQSIPISTYSLKINFTHYDLKIFEHENRA
ncbi:hypothetical protein RF11_15581 [Thelohanellus kitauei]|uniref:Uncharacterized protein n=1 Tax=Thelohanellus kitauei TaxID=669202 RepID=A0A0C2MAI0_THEKT|nr:hypothetical protein RF11_15581 [Thelohanellus kitauei]